VSLTLGAEDGCAFLCHLAELIQFVVDEGFSGLQKQKLLPTILAPWHLLSDWERLLRQWIVIPWMVHGATC